MAGLWELPAAGAELTHICQNRADLHPSKRKSALAGDPGVGHHQIGAANEPPVLTLRHSITDTDYVVTVHQGEKKATAPAGARWVALAKLASLPLTGLARKILHRLQLI